MERSAPVPRRMLPLPRRPLLSPLTWSTERLSTSLVGSGWQRLGAGRREKAAHSLGHLDFNERRWSLEINADSSRSMAHQLLLEAYTDDFSSQRTHRAPAQICGPPPSPPPGWDSANVPCACGVREACVRACVRTSHVGEHAESRRSPPDGGLTSRDWRKVLKVSIGGLWPKEPHRSRSAPSQALGNGEKAILKLPLPCLLKET